MKIVDGSGYAVTVKTQPPAQTCTVNNGSGTVSGADVTAITVTCSATTYTVGGTVSGLTGSGLVLQNSGTDDLSIGANGSFVFSTPTADNSSYAVTVKTQPKNPAQSCIVSSGTGTVSANITGVAVTCSTAYPHFAYVANSYDNTISIYTVDAVTGQLHHNGYAVTGFGPVSIAVDPLNKFVYTADMSDSAVAVFTINQTTGALTRGTDAATVPIRSPTPWLSILPASLHMRPIR